MTDLSYSVPCKYLNQSQHDPPYIYVRLNLDSSTNDREPHRKTIPFSSSESHTEQLVP